MSNPKLNVKITPAQHDFCGIALMATRFPCSLMFYTPKSTIMKQKKLENNHIGNSSRYSEIPLIYVHILGAKKFCRT